MRIKTLNLLKLVLPALLALSVSQARTTANGWNKYSVYFVDANYYYVIDDVTEKRPGVDYLCVSMQGQVCMVNSMTEPDPYGRIPISDAYPVYYNSTFISLEY